MWLKMEEFEIQREQEKILRRQHLISIERVHDVMSLDITLLPHI